MKQSTISKLAEIDKQIAVLDKRKDALNLEQYQVSGLIGGNEKAVQHHHSQIMDMQQSDGKFQAKLAALYAQIKKLDADNRDLAAKIHQGSEKGHGKAKMSGLLQKHRKYCTRRVALQRKVDETEEQRLASKAWQYDERKRLLAESAKTQARIQQLRMSEPQVEKELLEVRRSMTVLLHKKDILLHGSKTDQSNDTPQPPDKSTQPASSRPEPTAKLQGSKRRRRKPPIAKKGDAKHLIGWRNAYNFCVDYCKTRNCQFPDASSTFRKRCELREIIPVGRTSTRPNSPNMYDPHYLVRYCDGLFGRTSA